MKTLKYGLLAATAFGAIVAGTGDANATAYAYSFMRVRDFILGSPVAFGGNFGFLASTAATIKPPVLGITDGDSDDAGGPFSVDRGIQQTFSLNNGTGLFGSVDPDQAFVTNNGAPAPAENFGFTGADPTAGQHGPGNTSFARADHHLQDTLINVTGEGVFVPDPDTGEPTDVLVDDFGGDWDSVAESAVVGGSTGEATNAQNTQVWNFAPEGIDFAVDTVITITFNLDALLIASLTAEEFPPVPIGTAEMDMGINFSDQTVGDGGPGDLTITMIAPDVNEDDAGVTTTRTERNISFLITSQGGGISLCGSTDSNIIPDAQPNIRSYTCTFTLLAGTYDFVVNASTLVETASVVQQVVEPATLGLLGLGLVGAGFAARRRRLAA